MEILKQVLSKEKAFHVIESCENIPQCNSSENYVELYYNKFEDRLGYEELKRFLRQHKEDLLKPRQNN